MKKKESLLTDDFEHCYLCGGRAECVHHIFFGPNRKNSEREHLIVPLCNGCHNMSDHGVHFDREKDLRLKREAQYLFEQKYSHKRFMEVFGRNYL